MLISAMLRVASHTYLVNVTKLINDCLASGRVPSALQTGKMNLIDKKPPFLEVNNKQPLTVSSATLSIIIHMRMNAVCEWEGFYGLVQYGFGKKIYSWNKLASCYFF